MKKEGNNKYKKNENVRVIYKKKRAFDFFV